MTVKAKTVAEYLLTLQDEDAGDLISHLKLQKLLYYAQGFHLALFGKVLFSEHILKWEHGPVVAALYGAFKEYGGRAIPRPTNPDFSSLSAEQTELLDEVYEVCGQFSAWKLRDMTHKEAPWNEVAMNEEITPGILQSYFSTRLSKPSPAV